ncbi:hypothetical protein AVEN_150555-1, partial [Araneus ventricosus]
MCQAFHRCFELVLLVTIWNNNCKPCLEEKVVKNAVRKDIFFLSCLILVFVARRVTCAHILPHKILLQCTLPLMQGILKQTVLFIHDHSVFIHDFELFQAPSEIRSSSFSGCLYEVLFDGRPVGLWNFLSNVGCDGCKEG